MRCVNTQVQSLQSWRGERARERERVCVCVFRRLCQLLAVQSLNESR